MSCGTLSEDSDTGVNSEDSVDGEFSDSGVCSVRCREMAEEDDEDEEESKGDWLCSAK